MMFKKMMALLLAGVLSLSLVACGGNGGSQGGTDNEKGTETAIKIAMVTDSGDITDQSFNQMTYESCKAWASANGATFQYYKPERDSDEARNASIDQAVADGANVVVLPGYMFAASVVAQTGLYPDVKFIGMDIAAGDICEKGVGEGYDYNPANWNVKDYYNTANTYCCTYQEEISGYMAGYAAVKLGYRHLGFLGGMSVPAVTRFGYGYVQGANYAAKELGVTDKVSVEYVCGGQFYGDADITAYMDTWYKERGVEVVFACGGGIYTSAAEAAAKGGDKVIGVDSDQAPVINANYGDGITVTSAMKGLGATVNMVLTAIKNGEWNNYVGKIDNLGLVSETPEENYVQLPLENTQWSDDFTKEDYLQLVKDIYNGTIKVSNDTTAMPKTEIKVNDYGSIK